MPAVLRLPARESAPASLPATPTSYSACGSRSPKRQRSYVPQPADVGLFTIVRSVQLASATAARGSRAAGFATAALLQPQPHDSQPQHGGGSSGRQLNKQQWWWQQESQHESQPQAGSGSNRRLASQPQLFSQPQTARFSSSGGSSYAASLAGSNGDGSSKNRSTNRNRSWAQQSSRSSARRPQCNRSSGQPSSSIRNRSFSRSRKRFHNKSSNSRPNDGTPEHRRRSSSGRRRPAGPPPTQCDVSWEELLIEQKWVDRQQQPPCQPTHRSAARLREFALWALG